MAEDLGFRFTWFGHSCVEIETEVGVGTTFRLWVPIDVALGRTRP